VYFIMLTACRRPHGETSVPCERMWTEGWVKNLDFLVDVVMDGPLFNEVEWLQCMISQTSVDRSVVHAAVFICCTSYDY